MPEIQIRAIDADELERIEPLWNALREHHSSVTPELGEPFARAESWALRRAQYARWLREPDSLLLLAERSGEPVGYAMVRVREGSPTWPLAMRGAGEVETLSVAPSERGRGTGAALLTAVRARLALRGIRELSLHVMHTNENAMRFYERHGFRPYAVWVRSASASG